MFFFDFRDTKDAQLIKYFMDKSYICVVDFYADWCGPCTKLYENLENDIKNSSFKNSVLAPSSFKKNSDISKKIVFIKINIDFFEELSQVYEVVSIPHVVIYKNGTLNPKILRKSEYVFDLVSELL